MTFARLGSYVGTLSVLIVEASRQLTLKLMEGEGSALWTYGIHVVLGFPLSLISSPLLRLAQRPLAALPGPAAYLLILAVTFANWVMLGVLADRWRIRRRARATGTDA